MTSFPVVIVCISVTIQKWESDTIVDQMRLFMENEQVQLDLQNYEMVYRSTFNAYVSMSICVIK